MHVLYINIYGYIPLFPFVFKGRFTQHKSCQKRRKQIINENSSASASRARPRPRTRQVERIVASFAHKLLFAGEIETIHASRLHQPFSLSLPVTLSRFSAFFRLYLKYLSHSMQLAHKFCSV